MDRADLIAYPEERVRFFKESGFWRDETLTGWLGRHAEARPDHPALVHGEARLTYGELALRAERLAAGLAGIGLGRGDIVALQLPNIPEYVIAHAAIARIGAVMQTLHMPYRGAEMEDLLGHSGARAFICVDRLGDHPTAEVAKALRDRLPALEHVIVHGRAVAGAHALADLPGSAPTPLPRPPAPDDPWLLMYTSGTSASPKGVATSYRPFLNNVRMSAGEFALTPEDAVLSAAPFSHLYGISAMHLALNAGAAAVLLPRFTPTDFAAAIEAGRATALFTGPAHNAACLAAGSYDGCDLSSVRFAVISGAACPPELAREIDDRLVNGTVLQLWGMTEIQAGAYSRPGDPAELRHTSAGRASPGTELRVVGADGGVLPAGHEGELQIRGASVFPGYYNNDAANAAAFDGDWFRTGDLARIDAAGYLHLTGRLKEIINRGGVKFNPLDIEALINRMPQVRLSAIVPMPDPVLGEKACVFVEPDGEGEVTLEAIIAHLDAHRIARNKWPERLELVATMPLTPTNKIMKSKLGIPAPAR